MVLDPQDRLQAKRYAIYARKSSDESSGKQYKSIEDQLKECFKVADREGIVVDKKFVFTESKSAKFANNREVFTKLVGLVKKGTIDGIIAWHPDRLSRNMLEAGEVIDLIDAGKLNDLKFCIHHFENTAAGKMMLGILFAISKEYSDRLSDNIHRGVRTNFEAGKSSGTYRWGYERDEESGYYEPHPELFDYIQQAWRLRLEGKTNDAICAWLTLVGCERVTKNGNKIGVTRSTLTRLFTEPLYYGVLRQKGQVVDLREIHGFRPMITEEDFLRVQGFTRSRRKVNTRQQYPLRGGLVRCTCGQLCSPTIGTSHDKKHIYLYLKCAAKQDCPTGQHSLRSKLILDAIKAYLKENFHPTSKNYAKYKATFESAMEKNTNDRDATRKGVLRQKREAENDLEELIAGSFNRARQKKMDKTEQAVYEKHKFALERRVAAAEEQLKELAEDRASQSFSYDEFSNFLKNVDLYWKRADAEQKHQLARFLFSNITVGGGKVLGLELKPLIKELFVSNGGDAGS